MGNSSYLQEDYDTYKELCQVTGEKPKSFSEHFAHEKEICDKYDYEMTYYGFKAKDKRSNRYKFNI